MKTVRQPGESVKGLGLYVAWVDVEVSGLLHSCVIAMHPDREGLAGRIERWRRSDRWVCGKRYPRAGAGYGDAGAAHVEVSAECESPGQLWVPMTQIRHPWAREIHYRNTMHDLFEMEGMPLQSVDVVRAWGQSLGLRDVCMQRLWAKYDLQCGVEQ